MAFDQIDTDAVFRRHILPVVKSLAIDGYHVGSAPIRVDRIEHNDDIDDRIIAELNSCDFVIADLTYARPSVYFEAGFAQREVPVIYTYRKDHFRPREDDRNGHLKVHFDLQMKPIVDWRAPGDPTFSARLGRRLRAVLRPLVRLRAEQERNRAAQDDFEHRSMAERVKALSGVVAQQFKRVGPLTDYSHLARWLGRQVPTYEKRWASGMMLKSLTALTNNGTALTALRFLPKQGCVETWTAVISASGWTQPKARAAADLFVNVPGYNVAPLTSRQLDVSSEHVVLCSPGRISATALARLLTEAYRGADDTLVFQLTSPVPVISNAPSAAVFPTPEGAVLVGDRGVVSFRRTAYGYYQQSPGGHAVDYSAASIQLMREVEVHLLSAIASPQQLKDRLQRLISERQLTRTPSRPRAQQG